MTAGVMECFKLIWLCFGASTEHQDEPAVEELPNEEPLPEPELVEATAEEEQLPVEEEQQAVTDHGEFVNVISLFSLFFF